MKKKFKKCNKYKKYIIFSVIATCIVITAFLFLQWYKSDITSCFSTKSKDKKQEDMAKNNKNQYQSTNEEIKDVETCGVPFPEGVDDMLPVFIAVEAECGDNKLNAENDIQYYGMIAYVAEVMKDKLGDKYKYDKKNNKIILDKETARQIGTACVNFREWSKEDKELPFCSYTYYDPNSYDDLETFYRGLGNSTEYGLVNSSEFEPHHIMYNDESNDSTNNDDSDVTEEEKEAKTKAKEAEEELLKAESKLCQIRLKSYVEKNKSKIIEAMKDYESKRDELAKYDEKTDTVIISKKELPKIQANIIEKYVDNSQPTNPIFCAKVEVTNEKNEKYTREFKMDWNLKESNLMFKYRINDVPIY